MPQNGKEKTLGCRESRRGSSSRDSPREEEARYCAPLKSVTRGEPTRNEQYPMRDASPLRSRPLDMKYVPRSMSSEATTSFKYASSLSTRALEGTRATGSSGFSPGTAPSYQYSPFQGPYYPILPGASGSGVAPALVENFPIDPEGNHEKYWSRDRVTQFASLWSSGPSQNLGGRDSAQTQLVTATILGSVGNDQEIGTFKDVDKLRRSLLEGFERQSDPDKAFKVGRVIEVKEVSRAGTSMLSPATNTAVRTQLYVVYKAPSRIFPSVGVLPINTYNGLGVAKPGIYKFHHCIIYSKRNLQRPGEPPVPEPHPSERPGSGEGGMQYPPILVRQFDRTQRLDEWSRLDLLEDRTISVEYPYVKQYGEICGPHLQALYRNIFAVRATIRAHAGIRDSHSDDHAQLESPSGNDKSDDSGSSTDHSDDDDPTSDGRAGVSRNLTGRPLMRHPERATEPSDSRLQPHNTRPGSSMPTSRPGHGTGNSITEPYHGSREKSQVPVQRSQLASRSDEREYPRAGPSAPPSRGQPSSGSSRADSRIKFSRSHRRPGELSRRRKEDDERRK